MKVGMRALVGGVVMAAMLGAAVPAYADVTVCFSASVTINDDQVVNEADCQTVETP